MGLVDFTDIRDDEIRGKICEYMSEMLDNPDEHGLYETSKFMWLMETYCLELMKRKASETLYEFCGWLTTRKEPTIMSHKHNAAPVADRVNEFCKANKYLEPREGWESLKDVVYPED